VDRPLGVIGVPTSAGAFAPGQERAPAALREAGLIEALRDAGLEVRDHGDLEGWRWRPDRAEPRAQNVGKVAEIVRAVADRVDASIQAGERNLVLGGDCTTGIGTVAAHARGDKRIGLVYFDAHADLNIPDSVTEGALDWMGMAHMLAEPGGIPELAAVGPTEPLLAGDQVVLLGWDAEQSTEFERAAIERRDLVTVPATDVAANPAGAARRAREHLEGSCDRLLVHFDVDVIDFTDTPLSENWGRNVGISYEAALEALAALLSAPLPAAVTVTELNPDHVEEGAGTLERFAADLAAALAGQPDGPSSARSST
jgi:arginase